MNRKLWWGVAVLSVTLLVGGMALAGSGDVDAPAPIPETQGFAETPADPFGGFVKQAGSQTTTIFVNGSGNASDVSVGTSTSGSGGTFEAGTGSVLVTYPGGSVCLSGLNSEAPAPGVTGAAGSSGSFTFQPMSNTSCGGTTKGAADTVAVNFVERASS